MVTWCNMIVRSLMSVFFQPLEHKTPDWDHHAKCFKWNRFEATNQTIIHYSFAGMCLSSLDNCGPLPTLPFWKSGPFFGWTQLHRASSSIITASLKDRDKGISKWCFNPTLLETHERIMIGCAVAGVRNGIGYIEEIPNCWICPASFLQPSKIGNGCQHHSALISPWWQWDTPNIITSG